LELLTTEADKEKLTTKLMEFTKEVKDLPKQRRVMLEGFAKDVKKLPKLYDKELVKYIDNGLEVKVATIREISEDYGCTIATVVFYD
jgi:SPX domain protein involved in polyphosphate accumulation